VKIRGQERGTRAKRSPWVWAGALTAIIAAGLGVREAPGCDYVSPTTPILGYEVGDQNCSDGIDNDGDGAIDCDDVLDCPQGTLCSYLDKGQILKGTCRQNRRCQ
jgi:hypothetical protein